MNLAIEIGGTKLQIALGNSHPGEIQKTFRFQVEKEKGAAGILTKIEDAINGLSEKPASISVGFGGPLNYKTGVIATSHQIGGWSGFDLKKWFTDRYQVPVYIENDANAAALAEAKYGAGIGFEKVFYVTLGSGVGGGMVIDQKLYHGNLPGEAEIGLLRIDSLGNALESHCSGWALDEKIRKKLPESSLLKSLVGNQKNGEAKVLLAALEQDDPMARAILKEYANTLALGLSHVVHLFSPQVIILGGGVSLIGKVLLDAIKESLPQFLANAFKPGPEIRLSALKEEVVLIGALSLHKE